MIFSLLDDDIFIEQIDLVVIAQEFSLFDNMKNSMVTFLLDYFSLKISLYWFVESNSEHGCQQ